MRFSIITICKNACESIKRTIESVLSQSYDDFEYIIIDGASQDGTVDVIYAYANLKVKVISEPDKGISNAFNKGIKLSSGDLLFFLNSGDYFVHCDVLETVAMDVDRHDADVYTYSVSSLMNPKWPESKLAGEQYWEESLIPHQGTFIKIKVFDEIGLFNENFKIRMDYDFFSRCRKEGKKFYCNPIVITYYDSSGISSTNNYCFEKEGLAVRLLYHDRVEQNEKEIMDFLVGSDDRKESHYLNKIENQRRLMVKDHKIMVAMYKWIQLLYNGWNLEDYFLHYHYYEIAIYGFGLLGKILYAELLRKNFVVPYIIDQNKTVSDIKIISWDEQWDIVDCIVVTPFYLYRDISERIKREKGDFQVVSIEDILMN